MGCPPLLDYIDLSRRVQKMSDFYLSDPIYPRLPAYPRLEMSLVLIQTYKFDQPNYTLPQQTTDPQEVQLSLEEHMRENALNSPPTIRKKKGGCTCRKTKCLKMYCECFASGRLCSQDCVCYNCSNDECHSDAIVKAKELLKVRELNKSKSSVKGCICKKTQCQKKYCQCYNGGVACGPNCKCIGCQNGQCNHSKGSDSKQTIVRLAQSFLE